MFGESEYEEKRKMYRLHKRRTVIGASVVLLCLFIRGTGLAGSETDSLLRPEARTEILEAAIGFIGTPYVSGGSAPGGFDCSGLVCYLFKPYVPRLPRTAAAISELGNPIELPECRAGDLLFFTTMGPTAGISHVGIYAGDGAIVHAVSNGPETGVVVSSLESGYWSQTFHHARRVLPVEDRTAKPAHPDIQKPTSSPWDTYTGPVYGDFDAWYKRETEAFEDYKRRDAAGAKGR